MQSHTTGRVPQVPFEVLNATAKLADEDGLVRITLYLGVEAAEGVDPAGPDVTFPYVRREAHAAESYGRDWPWHDIAMVVDFYVTPAVASTLAYCCDGSLAGFAGQLSICAVWARHGVPTGPLGIARGTERRPRHDPGE